MKRAVQIVGMSVCVGIALVSCSSKTPNAVIPVLTTTTTAALIPSTSPRVPRETRGDVDTILHWCKNSDGGPIILSDYAAVASASGQSFDGLMATAERGVMDSAGAGQFLVGVDVGPSSATGIGGGISVPVGERRQTWEQALGFGLRAVSSAGVCKGRWVFVGALQDVTANLKSSASFGARLVSQSSDGVEIFSWNTDSRKRFFALVEPTTVVVTLNLEDMQAVLRSNSSTSVSNGEKAVDEARKVGGHTFSVRSGSRRKPSEATNLVSSATEFSESAETEATPVAVPSDQVTGELASVFAAGMVDGKPAIIFVSIHDTEKSANDHRLLAERELETEFPSISGSGMSWKETYPGVIVRVTDSVLVVTLPTDEPIKAFDTEIMGYSPF